MTVEAIRLQNFMAFKDTGWIELRPITLLFGRNSSGKSVLTRSLRLLRQSLDCPLGRGPFLYTVEDGVDVGSFPEMVHGRAKYDDEDETRDITFQFRCDIEKTWDGLRRHIENALPLFDQAAIKPQLELELVYRWHRRSQGVELDAVKIWTVPDADRGSKSPVLFEAILLPPDDADMFGSNWWFGGTLVELGEGNAWSGVAIGLRWGFLPFLAGDQVDLQLHPVAAQGYGVLISLLQELEDTIQKFLEGICYLGPVRPEPQRSYSFDQSKEQSWRRRGWSAFTGFLTGLPDKDKRETINRWIEMLGLGEEVTSKGDYQATDLVAKFHIDVKEAESELPLSLSDVGFGASQVLPIVAQGVLARPGDLVIIEQPELHLHPRAQADLGSLFAHLAGKGVKLLIETHSENLVLRLRRLMAETELARVQQKTLPGIILKPDMVSAFFIDRALSTSNCHRIRYDEWGRYLEQPTGFSDFFSSDFDELLAIDELRTQAAVRDGERWAVQ